MSIIAGAKRPESSFLLGRGSRYRSLLEGHKSDIAWLLLGGFIVASTIGLATPLLFKSITDEGIMKKDVEALLFLTLLGIAVMLVNALARYFIRLKRTRLRNELVQEICVRLLGDFYRLPYKSVLKKDKGYFISRIYDEAPRAVEPLLQMVVDLAVTGLSMLISLLVVVALSWRVALLVCIGVPLFHLLSGKISSKIRATWRQASENEALAKGVLERLVSSHRIIRIFGMQGKATEKFTRSLLGHMEKLFSNAQFSAIFWSVGIGFVNLSYLVVLALSGFEVIQGRMTIGSMIAITTIYARMINYAQQLVNAIPNVQNAGVTLERLFEFESQAEKQPLQLASADGVAVEGMGFAYDTEEVCSGLSLKIRKGERVLVVGSNGTGKTTLANILAGLLKPTAGTARVPSVDRISAAFFPPVFLPGSIAENVGYDRLSDEKKALFSETARAFEIEGLVDEDPQSLSAGQRQKASILRALLKSADLYIFDEPFSNIDEKTKGTLFQTILDATQGKSLLMVMHGEQQLHCEFDHVIDLDLTGSRRSKGRQGPQGEGLALREAFLRERT